MKHKAVEALVRQQFNIPEDTDVTVTFLALDGRLYDFEIEWWSGESLRYQCNCKLPHLECQKQDMEA